MNYYQEITLLPNMEIGIPFLWAKVYTQLHIAFAEKKNQSGVSFAVSFPEYGRLGLGNKLRVFAEDEQSLKILDLKGKVFDRLADYVHITSIHPVPVRRVTGYAVYSRYQPEGSPENKARRYIKRHDGVSKEQAVALFMKKGTPCSLPYVQLKSFSTNRTFSLFIQKQVAKQVIGKGYSTYGLSPVSSVPEF